MLENITINRKHDFKMAAAWYALGRLDERGTRSEIDMFEFADLYSEFADTDRYSYRPSIQDAWRVYARIIENGISPFTVTPDQLLAWR